MTGAALNPWDHVSVDYPVTMQEVLRRYLEERVTRYGRAEVARMLDCSTTALDYLRKGERVAKDGGKTQPNYISFEHIELLAKGESRSFGVALEEIATVVKALELDRTLASEEARERSRREAADPDRRS